MPDSKISELSSYGDSDNTGDLPYEIDDETYRLTPGQLLTLEGVESGATQNDTDANLKNRANHTGSQAVSTVSGLQAALDDKQPLNAALTGTTASFTTAQESKLAGIEAGADVTDATNVAAAGALMLTGGTLSGAVTFESSFIQADGNVGFGQANPQEKAHITAEDATLLINNATGNAGTVGIKLSHSQNGVSQNKVGIFSVADGSGWGRSALHICLSSAGDASDATVDDAVVSFANNGNATFTGNLDFANNWYRDIRLHGAVCDSGTTDDSAAIAAAIAAGYKNIYLPDGTTIQAGTLTITGQNGVTLYGDGIHATKVYVKGTTGDVITFSNCQHSGVEKLSFEYVSEPTSGWVIKFTNNCFTPFARIRCDYHYNGIWVEGASESDIKLIARYGFGPYIGLRYGGGSSYSCYGADLNYEGDNPAPVAVTTYKAYAGSTAFTLGQVTHVNSKIYVCTQAGTTGSASAPSTTSGNRFLTDITDGTVKWRFMADSSAVHVVMDSFAYSLRVRKSHALNAGYAFIMQDTQNTGSSAPKWAYLGLEADHSLFAGIQCKAGQGVYINDNAWIGSCMSGNGLACFDAFEGELTVAPTVRVFGNAEHGALLNVGQNYDIQGLFSGNSQKSTGTYNGITTGSGVTDFMIRATCGKSIDGGATQGYGISLGASNNNYSIVGCNLTGNATGGLNGHSASSTKVAANNLT